MIAIITILLLLLSITFYSIFSNYSNYTEQYIQYIENIKNGKNIPKQIITTIPEKPGHPKILKNLNKLQKKNKDWDLRIFDNNDQLNYIINNFPEYESYYKRINPVFGAARSDLFRYLIMYKEGGVYIDCKGMFNKPLNKIIKLNSNFLYSRNGHKQYRWSIKNKSLDIDPTNDIEIVQWFIITIPKNIILKKVIDKVIYNIKNYKELICTKTLDKNFKKIVWVTTGPTVYLDVVGKLINNNNSTKLPNKLTTWNNIKDYYSIYPNKYSYHQNIENIKEKGIPTDVILPYPIHNVKRFLSSYDN